MRTPATTAPSTGPEAPYRPVRIVSELAQSSISLAGVALLLLTYNWLLAAALLLAALPAVFARLRYSIEGCHRATGFITYR